MTKRRIICVGNSLVAADSVGLHVFDELRSRNDTDSLEVLNGGLGGLNLLPFFDGCEVVVLVDRVVGFAESGAVVHLDWQALCSSAQEVVNCHSGGLLYLLKALPHLGLKPSPRVCLIGIEGAGERKTIRRAADMALEAASAVL